MTGPAKIAPPFPAFIAKSIVGCAYTRQLLHLLRYDSAPRSPLRLEQYQQLPNESTFSRPISQQPRSRGYHLIDKCRSPEQTIRGYVIQFTRSSLRPKQYCMAASSPGSLKITMAGSPLRQRLKPRPRQKHAGKRQSPHPHQGAPGRPVLGKSGATTGRNLLPYYRSKHATNCSQQKVQTTESLGQVTVLTNPHSLNPTQPNPQHITSVPQLPHPH